MLLKFKTKPRGIAAELVTGDVLFGVVGDDLAQIAAKPGDVRVIHADGCTEYMDVEAFAAEYVPASRAGQDMIDNARRLVRGRGIR